NDFAQLFLYDTESGKTTTLTTDRYDSWSAAWSPDGEWLYFLSDRNLKTSVSSPWGPRQPDPFIVSPTEIFALAVKKDARFPFAPPDELHADEAQKEPKKDAAKPGEKPGEKPAEKPGEKPAEPHKAKKPVTIDLEGIADRLYQVPVPSGRLRSLRTDGHRLYWLSVETALEPKKELVALAIGHDKPKTKTVMEDVKEY